MGVASIRFKRKMKGKVRTKHTQGASIWVLCQLTLLTITKVGASFLLLLFHRVSEQNIMKLTVHFSERESTEGVASPSINPGVYSRSLYDLIRSCKYPGTWNTRLHQMHRIRASGCTLRPFPALVQRASTGEREFYGPSCSSWLRLPWFPRLPSSISSCYHLSMLIPRRWESCPPSRPRGARSSNGKLCLENICLREKWDSFFIFFYSPYCVCW